MHSEVCEVSHSEVTEVSLLPLILSVALMYEKIQLWTQITLVLEDWINLYKPIKSIGLWDGSSKFISFKL